MEGMRARLFFQPREAAVNREPSSGALHRQHRHEHGGGRARSRGHSRGRSRSCEPRRGRSASRGSRRSSRGSRRSSRSSRRSSSVERQRQLEFDISWMSQVRPEDSAPKPAPPRPTLGSYFNFPEDSSGYTGLDAMPASTSSRSSASTALPSPSLAEAARLPSRRSLGGKLPPMKQTGQHQRKLQKKLSKASNVEASDNGETHRQEELFRRIEAQELPEPELPEGPAMARVDRPDVALDVESHHDETTSVASFTTATASLLEGRRALRFDERVDEPELEVVTEENSRNVLQDIFADEPWGVLLSDDAYGEVKQLGGTQQKAVLEVLKTLASGTWPEKFFETVCSHQQYKLRCAAGGELSVLWGIDFEYSREQKAFTEVIQIWHVVRPELLQQKADTVMQQWRATSRKFEGLMKALQSQPVQKRSSEISTRYPRTVASDKLQDSDVFSVRKFFTLDRQMLQSITMEDEHAGAAEEQFALRVSKREAAVIEKKGPAIVIGRSGSGKTLCCLYRLFYEYLTYWTEAEKAGGSALVPSNGNELVHLHQVFVTHSASLANKVLEYFSNLQAAHRKAGLQTKLTEQTRLPDTLKGLKSFPLFVTFRKFIIMVDGSLENRFFPRRHTGQLHPDKVIMAEAPDALDPISALREHHRSAQRAQAVNQAKANSDNQRKTEVDYELFKSKFWPKISPHAPRECDASLLWREIQSFIKGSYKVMDTEEGHLSLSAYQEVAKKASPGFEDHRPQIYKAFEAYEQLRKDWNCFDRMDVSFHVVKELKKRPYTGPPIHSVAVDEVQDLAQIELAIFFMIMKKPYEELFITGDTSQTVSRAVDFRFCDLRSLFHHFDVPPPELDQLIINYRSHQKILALSHRGVVRPLELAFPHAIDKLQADEGHRDGEKPVVVDDVPLEDLAQHVFNLDGCSAGIAFGASQCILVRTEESRKRLPKGLNNSLVLTVEQSKGLEFDDCILVNFFKDSLYKEWQTMKIFQQELLNEEPKDSESKRPRFDRLRHTLLCSELKHLYTAMTRTKHVLLIIEEDKEQADHMFELWKKMDLVNFGLMQEENAEARRLIHEHAGKNRGKDSWCNMGHNLMKRQLYQQAQSAFQRGEDENMAKICEAYMLAQEAARTMEEQEAEGVRLFQEAAELFGQRDALPEQAQCLLHGQRPLQAAKIFQSLGDEASKIKAAQAYAVAGHHSTAGKLYEEAKHLREAIENFLRADDIHNVKRLVLHAHEEEALSTEECFRYLQDTDAHDVAGELFFKERNYEQAASCFQSAGLLQEEAKCYLELGRPLLAAERLSASEDPEELLQAADLYRDLEENAKEVKCCRSILEIQATDDMLKRCIFLHQRLLEWHSAAQLLEKTDSSSNWVVAVTYYQKVKSYKEAGAVSERLAIRSPVSEKEWLDKALGFYQVGSHTVEQLRVHELLGQWKECGLLARQLKDFPEAAKFFLRVQDFQSAVECRLEAKDFGEAYSLLKDKSVGDVNLEIKCLEGLQKYNEAARLLMKTLPQGAQRPKIALKAFELAMKSRESWKDFLMEFRQEMPDPKIALQYFLEVADADQICDQLMALQKHLAAVSAASILGEPLKAIQLLDQKPPETTEERDWQVLEILLVATKQTLGRDKLAPLLDYVNELWERAQDPVAIAYIDYVDVVLSRRCGRQRGKREHPELRKSWKEAEERLQEGETLAICHQLAMDGSEKDLTWTLEQLDWYTSQVLRNSRQKETGKGARESKELNSLLEHYYQARPELHQVFFDTLRSLGVAEFDPSKVIPKCHRLAAKCQEARGCSGLVLLDPAAILNDMEESRLELLQKANALCKRPEDFCKPPGLWLRAWQEASEERKAKFKDGFQSSLLSWTWSSNGGGRLSKEVKQMIPEAVKDMWHKARESSEKTLRNKATTSGEFKQVTTSLQQILKQMVTLLREVSEMRGYQNESIAETLSQLVLEDLKVLMPICPEHVTSKCKALDTCPLEHPDVGKTHEAKHLLNSTKGHKPIFDGLGLHAWLQLVNVCQKMVRSGKCTSQTCQWLHPEEHVLRKMRDALRDKRGGVSYYDLYFDFKKLQDLETVAQPLVSDASKLPHGFGCCFFKDEEMMLNVRLVTILAAAMFQKSQCDLGMDACKEVLKRMCRSLYRYPDPEATELAKKTLKEIRTLKMISEDITWEVDGAKQSSNERCLLSLLLGRENQMQQRRSVATPIGAAPRSFQLNPDAAEFVPWQQSLPSASQPAERRAWKASAWTGNLAQEIAASTTATLATEAVSVQGGVPNRGATQAVWKPKLQGT